MNIRDRVKDLRRVPASELRPNPKNWRKHPQAQQDAIRGVLAQIGFAGAELARELPDGSLMLIDGHCRAEIMGNAEVPVLVLDVSESEADVLLATFDPISAMAEADSKALDSLLREVDTSDEAVASMLAGLAEKSGVVPGADDDGENGTMSQAVRSRVVNCMIYMEDVELLESALAATGEVSRGKAMRKILEEYMGRE